MIDKRIEIGIIISEHDIRKVKQLELAICNFGTVRSVFVNKLFYTKEGNKIKEIRNHHTWCVRC